MSCRQSLRSKPMEALIASSNSEGRPENRPPINLLDSVLSVMLPVRLPRRALHAAGQAILYALLLTGAIFADTTGLDRQVLLDAREGTMRKLAIHEQPKDISPPPMLDEDGSEISFEEFEDRILVLNFWATWCAPCRKEMPSLDRLQAEFSPGELLVVGLAAGRNEQARVQAFLESIDAERLQIFYDPRLKVATSLGVRGLPATLILNRDGKEIARLTGDAEWDDESAIHILRNFVDTQ